MRQDSDMWLSIADTCDLDLVSTFRTNNLIFEGYGRKPRFHLHVPFGETCSVFCLAERNIK